VYEQYRIDSAAWDERWGELFGHTQPGYVAVHGGGGREQPEVVREVIDPDTGVAIPVIEAPSAD
jgi:hypothetical protein